MSNIYIVEPPTSGKVLLKTTVGDIDLELWSKEAPKACRNFVQLCLEGYYNGTIFHRVVKGFIIQGGDPTGTGTGGESIYGPTFKDEFHSRLRFSRRGLLAMANAGRDDNASQFFFTLAATPELQNKHTIFGKVSGETIFNMLKLEDALVDQDERPVYPQKVIRTEVLYNPFTDIVPRNLPPPEETKTDSDQSKKKSKKSGVKNFKLLSFGSEAEEDEEETQAANKKYSGRSKSTHDLLQDPSLSSEPAVDDVPDDYVNKSDVADSEQMDRIRKKLTSDKSKKDEKKHQELAELVEEEEDEAPYVFGQARREEQQKKADDIRKEIRDLKRGYQMDKKKREEELLDDKKEKENPKSNALQEYEKEQEKYKQLKTQLLKKGPSREEFTLALLAKFQKKLADAKEKSEEGSTEDKESGENSDEDNWLTHKLHFEEGGPILAKDASTKGDDWFDITDPRNPINKRRREAGKAGPSKRDRH